MPFPGENHTLSQAVQQGQVKVRLQQPQGHTGKTRACADINDRLSGKRLDRQQCGRVEKVQLRHVRLAVDGRQVHDLIGFN